MAASEVDLRAMREKMQGVALPERKESERQSRMRHDGRANRVQTPVVTLTVGIPPDVKARLTQLCRRRNFLIKDFVLECLQHGFDTYDPQKPDEQQ